MSGEQPECRDNETTNRCNAPCEIGAEGSDFGAQHVRCDTLAVLGGLPNGVRDGVDLCRHELGAGQRASDGVGVKHRAMILNVLTRREGYALGQKPRVMLVPTSGFHSVG